MKIKIISNTSYQTFPETDDMLEIDDTLLERIGVDKQFVDDGKVVDYVDTERLVEEAKARLKEMDYKTSKRLDGEYTDEQWAVIVAERRELRRQIRELESQNADYF